MARKDKKALYQKLKRNLRNVTFKDVEDCLIAFGFTLEQNSGKATHYTISIDIPGFFDPKDIRTIVRHDKNLIPPYGKRALGFIERKMEYDNK